jgi:hypothetical protein
MAAASTASLGANHKETKVVDESDAEDQVDAMARKALEVLKLFSKETTFFDALGTLMCAASQLVRDAPKEERRDLVIKFVGTFLESVEESVADIPDTETTPDMETAPPEIKQLVRGHITSGKLQISDDAREQMDENGITLEEVEAALMSATGWKN